MSKQVHLPGAGIIALGVFVVIFVLLMVVGYGFLSALFFALAVALAVAIFFLVARDRSKADAHAAPASSSMSARATAAPFVSSKPSPEPEPTPAPGPDPTFAPEPAPASAEENPPVAAPAAEQSEPTRLDGPGERGPDDLKRIKGIGPKIEQQLNSMGFYHLDQIASWGPPEVAWMDEHLEDFRGRVSRDDWVGQARLLAGGGDTEFSRRVDEGDVYD